MALVGDMAGAGERVEGIVTPEAVVLELATAGFGSRLVSGAIDALVQVGIVLVLIWLLALASIVGDFDSGSNQIGQTIVAVSVFVVMFGYPVVSELALRGRTFGKMAVGLRAVTVDGAPLRFRHVALRAMGGLVDKWVPPGGIVGTLFILGTPGRQRIGDLLAGTKVIRDPRRGQYAVGLWFPVPYGLEAYAATIDPTAMTSRQYTVVRAYLLRNRELHQAGRAAVATELADRVAATINHRRDPRVVPEAFLLCAIARYQRQAFPAYQPAQHGQLPRR